MGSLSFEQKFSLIDKIVNDLENGNLSLEEVFEKYKDGINLCNELTVFLKELEGNVEHIDMSFDKGE